MPVHHHKGTAACAQQWPQQKITGCLQRYVAAVVAGLDLERSCTGIVVVTCVCSACWQQPRDASSWEPLRSHSDGGSAAIIHAAGTGTAILPVSSTPPSTALARCEWGQRAVRHAQTHTVQLFVRDTMIEPDMLHLWSLISSISCVCVSSEHGGIPKPNSMQLTTQGLIALSPWHLLVGRLC